MNEHRCYIYGTNFNCTNPNSCFPTLAFPPFLSHWFDPPSAIEWSKIFLCFRERLDPAQKSDPSFLKSWSKVLVAIVRDLDVVPDDPNPVNLAVILAMVELEMVNDEARLLFSTLQLVCFLINFLHLDCILLDLLITLVLCICVHVLVVYSSWNVY